MHQPMPSLPPTLPACDWLHAYGDTASVGDQADPFGDGARATNGVAMRDWADLLNAVKGRLAHIATTSQASSTAQTGSIGAQLLECVGALEQLQQTLAHELGRREQLEHEVFQARATLALVSARELQALHLSQHDGLTSLPNHSHFCERLERCAASVERAAFAVMYLDLDGFKAVNDAHGHDAGDELLKVISARLARAVRADDVVGRLGGDEFGFLLTGLAARAPLVELATKLMNAVQAPVRIGALTLRVRASIGIATFPADGASVEALLRHADAAMYVAKRERRGLAFFADCAVPDHAALQLGALRPQIHASRSV